MQQQPHLRGRAWPHLDAVPGRRRDQGKQLIDSGPAALDGRLGGKGVHQPRLQIAGVAKVHRRKLFAALIEREKLKIGGCVIQPGHALGRRSPGSGRNYHLEPAKVSPPVAVLAAVVQPENSQRQHAVHSRSRLGLADPDYSLRRCAFEQPPAHISRPKAVLQVHRRAESVHLCPDEMTGQNALQ